MKHVIYTPDDEDNRVVTVFGQTFKAGASVAVSDEVYAKLSENPTFEKGTAPKAAQKDDEDGASDVMDRKPVKVDGRSKAGRAAKDDEAKLRAAAHQSDLKEAEAEAAEEKAEKAKH